MKHIVTTGIILHRLNYGEADRIITVITPDYGKVRLMARGVRKEKSKLAGGIELFSISSITYIPGKRDISTLVSTRLVTHYGHIIEEINRTMTAYDILKLFDKATEDECEQDYYQLLVQALRSLNDKDTEPSLTQVWFFMRLLILLGHQPNLTKTTVGTVLDPDATFNFDYDKMGFVEVNGGRYDANDIKVLRLLARSEPSKMLVIKDLMKVIDKVSPLLKQTVRQFVQ